MVEEYMKEEDGLMQLIFEQREREMMMMLF
jgi:hypothetical protein